MEKSVIRNSGVVAVLGIALALGAAIGGSVPASAQDSRTTNGSTRSIQPITAISGSTLTLAVDNKTTRQVRTDASTIVFKNGALSSVSALKVGDKVEVNPAATLPSGSANRSTPGGEGAGNGSSAGRPSNVPSGPDPNKDEMPGAGASGGAGSGAGGSGGESQGSTPPSSNRPPNQTPGDPQKDAPSSSSGAPAAARLLWVQSGTEKLVGGTVRSVKGNAVTLYAPGFANSNYVVQVANTTAFKRFQTQTGAPLNATLANVQPGMSVVVLGVDKTGGVFAAKAVVIYPAPSYTGPPGSEAHP